MKPDDVSIPPGGSVTLKIPASGVAAYEKNRDAGKRAEPNKVEFDLQFINFGDGTGLEGTAGSPAVRPPKQTSANESCVKEQDSPKDVTASPGGSTERERLFLPANFSRAIFFAPPGSAGASSPRSGDARPHPATARPVLREKNKKGEAVLAADIRAGASRFEGVIKITAFLPHKSPTSY